MRILKSFVPLLLIATGLFFSPAGSAADEPDPVISITPQQFAFGPINVGGELGEPAEFTISNPGTVGVQLHDALIDGTDAGSFKLLPNGSTCYFMEPAGYLLPGASCTMVAIFDPESEGAKQAGLWVLSDSVTSPDVMPLTGTGFPRLLPGATIDPQELDFGGLQAGTSSEALTITLTSSGDGDLTIGQSITLGTGADQFQISSNSCSNRSVASGDTCQLKVVFAPIGSGERSATLTLPTDAAGADTTVELSGRAVPPTAERSSRVQVGAILPRLRRATAQLVPVRCATVDLNSCHGRVSLSARGRDLGLRHNRLVNIGSQAYDLQPGQRTVRVALTSRAAKTVRRRGLLPVRVLATSRQGDGSFRSVNVSRSIRR